MWYFFINSLHSWVSFSGFSEAYFECCQGCDKQEAFITYWEKREGASKYFSQLSGYLIHADSIPIFSDTSTSSKIPQLTRKMVSSMFYAGELEKEIRDPCSVHRMQWTFTYNSDKEEYMKQVVREQSERVYVHTPTPLCTKAGMWLTTPVFYHNIIYTSCALDVVIAGRWMATGNFVSPTACIPFHHTYLTFQHCTSRMYVPVNLSQIVPFA